jgi:hypothetical protein
MNILSLLKRPATTSADLRAKRDAIDIAALDAAITAAEDERRKLLLDGDDAAIRKAEAAIATAKLERERAEAALDALDGAIVAAEKAELHARLDADLADVSKRANAMEARLRSEYPKLTAQLVQLLSDLWEVEKGVYAINDRLGDSGRGNECIPFVEWRIFSYGIGGREFESILATTRIRERFLPDGNRDLSVPSWPPIGMNVHFLYSR